MIHSIESKTETQPVCYDALKQALEGMNQYQELDLTNFEPGEKTEKKKLAHRSSTPFPSNCIYM